ncbi:Uncharacterized protein dnl_52350 [Desulfonema limicola]|uniref:Uncharacterized protein n=1 Tax=Desulfonema limicola TaxID=45656 RepID=A0A975BCM9_9BACT|nr:Uncharacterized protein dnl_52350 [Desulfonema limicola]
MSKYYRLYESCIVSNFFLMNEIHQNCEILLYEKFRMVNQAESYFFVGI